MEKDDGMLTKSKWGVKEKYSPIYENTNQKLCPENKTSNIYYTHQENKRDHIKMIHIIVNIQTKVCEA